MKVNHKLWDHNYRVILESMSDVVWIIGIDDRQSYVSPSITRFLGCEPQEFLATPLEELLMDESLNTVKQVMDYYVDVYRTLSDDPNAYKHERNFELQFLCKDQSEKWAEVKTNLVTDHKNDMKGVQFVMRDITNRKRFEENTVKMLNREKELNSFKTQVISTFSHELRTPLSIIYSNLQLLKKFSYKIDEEIQKDAFELTTIAIQSLSKTLDNLTFLNQSNKGVLNFNPEKFNLLDEVKRIASEISSINHNDGRIVTNFNFPDHDVLLDKTLLNHILSNLLVNALKFSPDNTKVEFNLEDQEGKAAKFVIIDKGIGIPEDELQMIYESFYRGSNTKGVKGSGLGLSIVKRCVDLHKGSLNIKSELDIGTEVNLIIPYEHI